MIDLNAFITPFDAMAAGTATIGHYISIGIFAYVALSLVMGLFTGLSRGFGKTAIRILTILAAAVVTYVFILFAFKSIDDWFIGKTIDEAISSFIPDYRAGLDEKTLALIDSIDIATAERIIMLVFGLVVGPTIFIAGFYLVKAVLMIVYWILSAILGFSSRDKGFLSVIGGGLLGLVQGALIAYICLIPVTGFAGIAAELREPLTADDKPAETVELIDGVYTAYIDDALDNPVLAIVGEFGGDMLFTQMTTLAVEGENVDMQKEAKNLAEIAVDALPLANEFKWDQLTDEHKAALLAILDDVGDDKYAASIVAGIFRSLAASIHADGLPIEIEEPFASFADEFVAIFDTETADNLKPDLKTFLEVYFILSDSGFLTEFTPDGESTDVTAEELLITDNGDGTVISRVINKLNTNPRTAPIVTSLAKFSLQLMAQTAGNTLPEDVDITEVYEDVKTGMNGVLETVNDDNLTRDEKKDAVKETLDTTLKNVGIITEDAGLSEEVMDTIADYAVDNFKDIEELTDQDINNAILAYYDAYAKGAPLPDLDDVIGGETGGSDTEGGSEGTEGSSDGTEGGSDITGGIDSETEGGSDITGGTDGETEGGSESTDTEGAL